MDGGSSQAIGGQMAGMGPRLAARRKGLEMGYLHHECSESKLTH